MMIEKTYPSIPQGCHDCSMMNAQAAKPRRGDMIVGVESRYVNKTPKG
jgi:hypothetical protein